MKVKTKKMSTLENIFKFKDRLLEFIFPPRCMFCTEVIEIGRCVCAHCAKAVVPNLSVRTILEWGSENIECVSFFEYSGKIREAICQFKFNGEKRYGDYFSDVIINKFPGICEGIDFVTAVPLSDLSFRKRGYNQSECLARSVARKLGKEYKDLLIKVKENYPQHELALSERIKNVKGVYKALDVKNIKNKNILLFDDIITTGNTLKECVKMLKLFGAHRVICCTVAYVL